MFQSAFGALGLCSNYFLHRDQLSHQKGLYHRSLNKTNELHLRSMKLSREIYQKNIRLALMQHFQQLNTDLLAGTRESERDQFDQRNQHLQTLILSCTVMFSALSTVIIQGPLDPSASQFLINSYALVCALSFATLFISIIISIETVIRASSYMYTKSDNDRMQFIKLVETLNNDLKTISSHSGLTDTSGALLQNDFNDNETRITRIMKRIERNLYLDVSDFNTFWTNHCAVWLSWAIASFYAGVVTLIVAIAIFLWSEFTLHYKDQLSGVVGVSVLCTSLFIIALVALLIKYIRVRSGGDKSS